MIYEELTNIGSLADFVFYESLQDKPDFLLDMVYWWLGKFVNTHQIVGFIGAVFYYGLMLGVIRHFCIIFVNEDKAKAAFFYLLFLFLALTTIYEFSGMRQGNAILLFLFIITIPENKISEKCRALLLVLPGLLHFSLYPIVLLYLCTYWMRKKQVLLVSVCMLIGYFFFIPLMQFVMNLCYSLGGIFGVIADKIDWYMFSGDLSVMLYAGSGIRFAVILFLVALSPLLIYVVDKGYRNRKVSPLLLRFHAFFILFWSYLILSSSSYILSRNLMLYKFVAAIYLVYILYSFSLKEKMRTFLLCLVTCICILGVLSFYRGGEWHNVNPAILYSNLFDILSLKTNPAGYIFN